MWSYMNCLGLNPCHSFLTRNETMRQASARRLEELSSQYVNITTTQTYKNFKMGYLGRNFFKSNMEDWVRRGGDALDLVATIDGNFLYKIRWTSFFLTSTIKSRKGINYFVMKKKRYGKF
jgi:hypothetical protein